MSTPTAPHDHLVIGARVVAVLALLLGIAEIGLGVAAWIATDRTTGEAAEFAGLGYIVALVLGVPGVVATVLGGAGLAAGRHGTAAAVLAAVGAAVAMGPPLVFLALHS